MTKVPMSAKIESKRRRNDTCSVAAAAFLISHLEKYLIFTSNVLISYGEGDWKNVCQSDKE